MSIWTTLFGGHEIRADTDQQQGMVDVGSIENGLLKLIMDPKELTKEKALQIPTVRACLDLISGTVSRLPIRLYRRTADGAEEVLDDPRTIYLNSDPGDIMTAKMFWRAIVEDYYLGKGAFVYIEKEFNRVTGLYYVKEEDISVLMQSFDPIYKKCTYGIMGKSYQPFEFIRLLRCTHDGYESKSLIEEHSLLFAVAYGYLAFEKSNVDRGGIRKGFLKSQKRLTDVAMQMLRQAFNAIYNDPDNNVVVLNDSIDFKEASSTNQELQLLDNKDSCAAEIAKIFGIPSSMLTGSKSRDSNAAEDKKRYIATCLALMEDIECSLNRDLLLEEEKKSLYFAFDTRELTKECIQERYEAYRIGLESNFLQIDEVRGFENLKPLDIDFVQLKLGSVFYNPKTGIVYTPNTNAAMDLTEGATMNLGDALQGGGIGQNKSRKINLPGGGTKDLNEEGGEGDESGTKS